MAPSPAVTEFLRLLNDEKYKDVSRQAFFNVYFALVRDGKVNARDNSVSFLNANTGKIKRVKPWMHKIKYISNLEQKEKSIPYATITICGKNVLEFSTLVGDRFAKFPGCKTGSSAVAPLTVHELAFINKAGCVAFLDMRAKEKHILHLNTKNPGNSLDNRQRNLIAGTPRANVMSGTDDMKIRNIAGLGLGITTKIGGKDRATAAVWLRKAADLVEEHA